MRTPQEVYDLKLFMEKRLEKKIGKWFLSIIETTAEQMRRGGAYAVYVPVELRGHLEAIMMNHYKETMKANLPEGMSTKSDKSEISEFIRKVVAEIETDVETEIDKKAEKQIDKTFTGADKRMKRLAVVALLMLQKETDEISNEAMTKIYKTLAKDRIAGSAKGIATIQTGWVAEMTRNKAVKKVTENIVRTGEEYIKATEAVENKPEILKNRLEALSKYSEREKGKEIVEKVEAYVAKGSGILARGALAGFALIKKMWVTMGDELVRATHRAVNGVILPIEENFVVGAYEMAYPLDSSKGAGLEEIAECRCLLKYI